MKELNALLVQLHEAMLIQARTQRRQAMSSRRQCIIWGPIFLTLGVLEVIYGLGIGNWWYLLWALVFLAVGVMNLVMYFRFYPRIIRRWDESIAGTEKELRKVVIEYRSAEKEDAA